MTDRPKSRRLGKRVIVALCLVTAVLLAVPVVTAVLWIVHPSTALTSELKAIHLPADLHYRGQEAFGSATQFQNSPPGMERVFVGPGGDLAGRCRELERYLATALHGRVVDTSSVTGATVDPDGLVFCRLEGQIRSNSWVGHYGGTATVWASSVSLYEGRGAQGFNGPAAFARGYFPLSDSPDDTVVVLSAHK